MVSQFELIFAEFHTPTETLGDAEAFVIKLTGELEAHSTETRTALGVDADARHELADDRTKVAGFESARRGNRATRLVNADHICAVVK